MTSKPLKDDLVRQEETYLIRLSSDKPAPDKTIPEKQRCMSLVLVFPCIDVSLISQIKKKNANKIVGWLVINQYTSAIWLQKDTSELT